MGERDDQYCLNLSQTAMLPDSCVYVLWSGTSVSCIVYGMNYVALSLIHWGQTPSSMNIISEFIYLFLFFFYDQRSVKL